MSEKTVEELEAQIGELEEDLETARERARQNQGKAYLYEKHKDALEAASELQAEIVSVRSSLDDEYKRRLEAEEELERALGELKPLSANRRIAELEEELEGALGEVRTLGAELSAARRIRGSFLP